VRCVNAQRTHCYALRGETIRDLYRHWISNSGHCDHLMGPFLARRNTYAPSPFLAGQGPGPSDINGGVHPEKFWDYPPEGAAVILARCGRAEWERLRSAGLHGGYAWEADGSAAGLAAIVRGRFAPDERGRRLRHWLATVEMEAWATGAALPAFWLPDLTDDEAEGFRQDVGGRLIAFESADPVAVREFVRRARNPRWVWD
jgi:hypothetical protein